MKILRVSASINLYNAFRELTDITRDEINSGSWIDRYEPKIYIEKTSFVVEEENENYYVIKVSEDKEDDEELQEKVYKQEKEDELCMYCFLWPEVRVHEASGCVYVKEDEELTAKQILFSEFSRRINKMIKFCETMKTAIKKESDLL